MNSGEKECLQRGEVWVAREHWIEYLRPCYEGDELTVFSWVANLSGPRSLRRYAIKRGARLVSLGATEWVYIDYKTGQARKTKEVSLGYAPQLPIEGIIAAAGGFKGIDAAEVQSLRYWRLGKEEICVDKDIKDILQRNLNNIKQLIAIFDNPDKPYLTQPNPKYAPTYSDYEHLSRIKEWGISDNNDNS